MMKNLIAGSAFVLLTLAGCGAPPEYTLNGTPTPVDVAGDTCSAQLYDVTYRELTDLEMGEGPIERATGTQYRVTCGTVTTNCGLNQELDPCLALVALNGRRDDDDSGGSGYSPPG